MTLKDFNLCELEEMKLACVAVMRNLSDVSSFCTINQYLAKRRPITGKVCEYCPMVILGGIGCEYFIDKDMLTDWIKKIETEMEER